ncbi:IS30 family transposase [Kurthia massiliensis]|uniref:IS30 family transposase n=1 Tax=Kurthia massiliensis TaxID=1033739 RepID=UPI0011C96260
MSRYSRQCFQTFTTDRGKEFSCYAELEKQYGIPCYFADPYAPWQRGTSENSNALLREFFPKRMDLGQLISSEIEKALSLINNRSRKCLDWNTTQDAFEYEVVQLI